MMKESYFTVRTQHNRFRVQCILTTDDGFEVTGHSESFYGYVDPMEPDCYERRKAAYQAAEKDMRMVVKYQEYVRSKC